jgi:hypothetical protein
LARGKQREQGNNNQGTGNTHLWLSRQVPPRYAGWPLITTMSWTCHVPETFGLTLEVGAKGIWQYLVRLLDARGFV